MTRSRALVPAAVLASMATFATLAAAAEPRVVHRYDNADGFVDVRLDPQALANRGLIAEGMADGSDVLFSLQITELGGLHVNIENGTVTGTTGVVRLDGAGLNLLARSNRRSTREDGLRASRPIGALTLRSLHGGDLAIHTTGEDEALLVATNLKTAWLDAYGTLTVDADLTMGGGLVTRFALEAGPSATVGRLQASIRMQHAQMTQYDADGNITAVELTAIDRQVSGGNNGTVCPTPVGTDVIVGDLIDITNYASSGGIEAFAVGTTSCNVGDANLLWIANSNEHPVIGQTMYRLKDQRLTQIGQSWLKHGFTALTQNACGCGCSGQGGSVLGVGCSDPYCCGLNGQQGGLGPKFEVNAYTGFFEWPHTADGQTGNSIYKRLQVDIDDLDPALNTGALYFVEGQYVTPDDAAAGNQNNNASYRAISISGSGTAYSASLTASTQREQPAIRAWQDNDPSVIETDVIVPNEGLVIVAAKTIALGGGNFRYEYAVQNVTSDRSVRSFSVPVAGAVSGIGFHDVPYHSGEPFSGTDWTAAIAGGQITWSTETFAANPSANALRWGTMYNFWFETNATPTTVLATLGLFKPGTPSTVTAATTGPATGPVDCNTNGVEDGTDIANGTSQDCNSNGIPDDCETFTPCTLTTLQVASGLNTPLYVTAPVGDPDRLFIVEQGGIIKLLQGGSITNYLNITGPVTSGGECGLLSMAFDPDFNINGHFYVNYTSGCPGSTVIARYTATGGNPAAATADPASAVILKSIAQDFSNHNGGQVQFGPDGMLYVGMGDGGSFDDPNERAQNDGSLLGKMLRLDVNNPPTYIPADNPYVGAGNPLDEIWAKGLRNPWRFSFDRLTGDMYIGDVGQDAREEIDFQPFDSVGTENYGWDCREGFIASPAGGDDCTDPPYVDPILDVAHGTAGTCSITGGYVYRGCEIPHLSGTYFFADWCGDYIRSFEYEEGDAVPPPFTVRTTELQPAVGSLTSINSFGEDGLGELYIVSATGSVFKIICTGATPVCGNGDVELGEQCDDGNVQPGDGCDGACQIETGCGDGIIEAGEECEPPNGTTCDCDCQFMPCETALDDNFDCDTGWTTSVAGASSGQWQRGIPVNDPNWDYDPTGDGDGSGLCYLTQNEIGNTDVDGGSVTLTSPTIDMSLGSVTISYLYYLNLTNENGVDQLLFQINNNDGVGAWTTLATHTTDGGLTWRSQTITQANLDSAGVTLTATMRVRFTANDGEPQSINEAGVDAFLVTTGPCFPDCNDNGIDDALDIADCTGDPACSDCNGNGVPDGCDVAAGTSTDCDGGPVGVASGGASIIGTFCFGCHNADGSGGTGFPGPNIRNKSRTELLFITTPAHPGGQFPFTQQEFADLEAFLADGGSRGRPDGVPDSCQTLADCDTDSASDACELEAGTEVDLDYNGIPDVCDDPCVEPCDDGNACTINDVCAGNICIGTPVDCSGAGDACNQASCDLAGAEGNCDILTETPNGAPCDDGNACTETDTCLSGACGGQPVDCSAFDDDCNIASCDAGGPDGNCAVLTPLANGSACDDGSACTVADTCQAGACTPGTPPDCSGIGDDCNGASCDAAGSEGNCDLFGTINEGGPCNAGSGTCAAGVCIDPGDTRVFMVRTGQHGGAPLVGNTTISMAPGSTVTLEVWAADTDDAALGAFQFALPGSATPEAGATGTVSYVDNPDAIGGNSVLIDTAHPDWVFAFDPSAQVFYSETGLPNGFAALAGLPLGSGIAIADGDMQYLGEFQLSASGDADGTFTLGFLPDGAPPNGGSALVDNTAQNEIQANYQPLQINIAASTCIEVADCADLDANNISDDNCQWFDCDAGTCLALDRIFGDAGGSFDDCNIDGFTNVHDRNHVLRCFASTSSCETLNIDVGGSFGDCNPDGFCNVHDANHVNLAFAGTNTCTCPSGPAPEFNPTVVGETRLALVAGRQVTKGGTVDVHVVLDTPVSDLQSYQLAPTVSGGQRGALELVDVTIAARKDAVFHSLDQPFSAFNVGTGQMLSGLPAAGKSAPRGAYLATFSYRATADAAGIFVVDLDTTGPNWLIASGNGMIEITTTTPARIQVGNARLGRAR